MVQTAATSRSFAGEAPDINRDFVGVGAGSILSGLFGAFAVNASPPRTAIAAQSGGRSQFSGLIAAAIVLALGAFGGGLLADVPQAALAGVLLFVAQHILRWKVFASVYRQAPVEFLLILVTMTAIVVLPIETGVRSASACRCCTGCGARHARRRSSWRRFRARRCGGRPARRPRASSSPACWSRRSRRRCPSSMPTASSAASAI